MSRPTPMSMRQQMKQLEKEEEERAAAEAAAAAKDEADDYQHKPKQTSRATKDTAKTNPPTNKKKKPSLKERKESAREKAKKKRTEEDASMEEETTSQEEGNNESSEAEFGEEVSKEKKLATRKRRMSEDGESSQNDDMEGEEGKLTEPRRLTRLSRKRTRQTSAVLVHSESEKGRGGDDVAVKVNVSASIPKKGTIPRRTARGDEIPKTDVIPKKGEIPRRKPGDGTSEGGDAKPTSSLLQNMAPGNPALLTPTMNATSAQLLTKSLQPNLSANKPLRAVSGDASRVRNPQQPSSTSSSVQMSPVNPGFSGGMTPPPPPSMEGQKPPPQPSQQLYHPATREREKENRVLQAISNMCDSLNKDNRFQIRSGPAIDMAGSFLSDERYDFFDVDSHGDIMLQAKIPIFPEDFPPGKTEWPLSWWGIVDPALAPSPKIIKVEETTGSEERTAQVEVWPDRPNELLQQQRQQEEQPQRLKPPPLPQVAPPPSYSTPLPPPHFRPQGEGGRGGFSRGGRGGPWARGGGVWGRGGRGPPSQPMHGVPPPHFPPGGPRGRGMRPADRPLPPPPDNRKQPPGRY